MHEVQEADREEYHPVLGPGSVQWLWIFQQDSMVIQYSWWLGWLTDSIDKSAASETRTTLSGPIVMVIIIDDALKGQLRQIDCSKPSASSPSGQYDGLSSPNNSSMFHLAYYLCYMMATRERLLLIIEPRLMGDVHKPWANDEDNILLPCLRNSILLPFLYLSHNQNNGSLWCTPLSVIFDDWPSPGPSTSPLSAYETMQPVPIGHEHPYTLYMRSIFKFLTSSTIYIQWSWFIPFSPIALQ